MQKTDTSLVDRELVLKKQASDALGFEHQSSAAPQMGTLLGFEGMPALQIALATLKESGQGDGSEAHTFSSALKRSTPGPFFQTPSMAVSALASTA